jgi:hypothetical protein
LGLQAQSDAAREVFPIRVTQGFILNSWERKGCSFSGLFQQPAIEEQQLCVQTNWSGFQALTTRLQK